MYTYRQRPTGYYVYAYICEVANLPYYIGKGKKDRAWTQHDGVYLPDYWDSIIILEENLTNELAYEIEKRLIDYYGRQDLGTGILLNKAPGKSNYSYDEILGDTWKEDNNTKPSKIIEYENKMAVYITEHSNKRTVQSKKSTNHYEKYIKRTIMQADLPCKFPGCDQYAKPGKTYCCPSHQKKHAGQLSWRSRPKASQIAISPLDCI